LLVLGSYYLTIAIYSFIFEQLFTLLVPLLVALVEVVSDLNFPSEPEFVQNNLSILSKFVVDMIFPLRMHPKPKRLVLLVLAWHPTMAIDSFAFDKLFTKHVPFLIKFRHGSQKALLKAG
jgi:hypothetical protein